MKNIDYNNLLMYVSLVLAIAILLSILFGCTYRKRNGYREYFTGTTETEPIREVVPQSPAINQRSSERQPQMNRIIGGKSMATSPAINQRSSERQPQLSSDANAQLNPTELQLKEKLVGGKINENDLQQMVDNKEVSTENLQKIIQSFQNDLKLQ